MVGVQYFFVLLHPTYRHGGAPGGHGGYSGSKLVVMKHDLEALIKGLESGIVKHVDARKLWRLVRDGHRPSDKTLDKLALLAGFQSWSDLREALRGENDASLNYEEETRVKGKKIL